MTCEGLARGKGSGVRKFEGLVEIAEAEAMGDGRWAAKVVCFFIYFSVKFVKSMGYDLKMTDTHDKWQMTGTDEHGLTRTGR
jgi:hypothetical protein